MKGFDLAWILALVAVSSPPARGSEPERRFDLSRDKVLYVVGYAHLDSQWRWTYERTIEEFLKKTLDENFALFEKYPDYTFNFTGSARYALMKEYYPEKYERLKRYVKDRRWFVCGSSVDEGDVNAVSPESVVRQVLYGNGFFRRELGVQSTDYMLPDCFGFPANLPSVLAHCGIKGFSTQKLSWGSAVEVPFGLGFWEGPDGNGVVAALKPGPYTGGVPQRLDIDPEWVTRIEENGRKYGLFADLRYYGVGDTGGAPREADVKNAVASLGNPDGRVTVVLGSADRLFLDLTEEQKKRLPRYSGDLLLTEHSAGSLTSQAYMKRWNRKNEQLADAAERAAVSAAWLGGAPYPREKLTRSWERVLASQMHDILPGTAIPQAYEFSWNDEVLALNGFAAVLRDSVGAISRAIDTRALGTPVAVLNPLAIEREDLVEATVPLPETWCAVRVFDPSGAEVPSQIVSVSDGRVTVLFLARVGPVGVAIFDVRPAESACAIATGLTVSPGTIENAHYRVRIDRAGDVASILDKAHGNWEILARPARLEFTSENPRAWPAWNMDWADRERPVLGAVGGPAEVRIVESGPARVTIEVKRAALNSIFTQRVSLAAGDAGRRVEVRNLVDWQSRSCALRASFPLTIRNPNATYNLGLGTIARGTNDPKKYEVPSREWFDLTDASGSHGVSVLEDCKFGSDKPADDHVRLTLLYSPGTRGGFRDQGSQDWGIHEFTYALYAHEGDWRAGRTEWQARRLNQPLRAFLTDRHDGPLGRSFSFVRVDGEGVDIRALKVAEDSDDVVLRLQELWGRPVAARVSFAAPIQAAFEVDGQERRLREARIECGSLPVQLARYGIASYAVRLATAPSRVVPPRSVPLRLPFDSDVVSRDTAPADGALDGEGRTLPAELFPERVTSEGVEFRLGPVGDGEKNAVRCRGQRVALPEGPFERLYLLAAATEDARGRFTIGDRVVHLTVQSWSGFIGQWDRRVFIGPKLRALVPGFVKRDEVAFFATHLHHPRRGNQPYRFGYLFKYGLDLPAGARTLTLPEDERIFVFAATAVRDSNDRAVAASPLYDDFTGRNVALRPGDEGELTKGLEPVGQVMVDRKGSFESLSMGPPSRSDCADRAVDPAVFFEFDDCGGRFRPHDRSGAHGRKLPRLNDGEVAQSDDDTSRCVWYDSEGRFYVDLGREVEVARVNTYSCHRSNRAPQLFTLWGASGEALPDVGFQKGADSGWTLLGIVDTWPLGEGGKHGSSVARPGGSLGRYRYLLFVAEDVGEGTFFTEIDVHADRVHEAGVRPQNSSERPK